MDLVKHIAIVGSRTFKNYAQLERICDQYIKYDDVIVSGGAIGADTFAQRYAKEHGFDLIIRYPKYQRYGKGATFERNKRIVEGSDLVLAFYGKGRFQQGGTSNSIYWAKELGVKYLEFEEEGTE